MNIPSQLKFYQWLISMILQQKQNLTLLRQSDSQDEFWTF